MMATEHGFSLNLDSQKYGVHQFFLYWQKVLLNFPKGGLLLDPAEGRGLWLDAFIALQEEKKRNHIELEEKFAILLYLSQ